MIGRLLNLHTLLCVKLVNLLSQKIFPSKYLLSADSLQFFLLSRKYCSLWSNSIWGQNLDWYERKIENIKYYFQKFEGKFDRSSLDWGKWTSTYGGKKMISRKNSCSELNWFHEKSPIFTNHDLFPNFTNFFAASFSDAICLEIRRSRMAS